jgi:hypothetical protein
MKRITVSLDVPDEDHEDVVEMLKSCVNRIAYNHPKAGAIRWLDDVVLKPKLVLIVASTIIWHWRND